MPPSPSGSKRKLFIGGGIAAVVVVIIVIIAVVASSGGSPTKPVVAPTTVTTTPSSTTPATTPTSSGTNGAAEPALLSVVPSTITSDCQQVPVAERGAGATDEVTCGVAQVSGLASRIIVYERFASSSSLNDQYGQLLSSNGITMGQGDCSEMALAGTSSAGTYCEGTYTQDDNNAVGHELVFTGSDFQLGGSTATQGCQGAGAPTTSAGVTVLVFTSPSDVSAAAVIACTASAAYASAIHQDFLAGNYQLNDTSSG